MKKQIFAVVLMLTACQSYEVKKEPKTSPLVHGHRGSRGTHPENTLPAFQEAVDAGANVLEMDLHLTKEGIPVLSHDPKIPAALCLDSAGKALKNPPYIRTLTLKKLKTYDCGTLKNPKFAEQKPVPKTQIPTLEEVLEWAKVNAKNIQFNIETKMDAEDKKLNPQPDFFSKTVIGILKRHGVLDRTILQSFDFSTLEAAKKIEPTLRLSALFETEKGFCAEANKMHVQIASPAQELLSKEQVDLCHTSGIQVAPWTLNTEAEWKNALDLGVDAIITDYPRKLVSYLKK